MGCFFVVVVVKNDERWQIHSLPLFKQIAHIWQSCKNIPPVIQYLAICPNALVYSLF